VLNSGRFGTDRDGYRQMLATGRRWQSSAVSEEDSNERVCRLLLSALLLRLGPTPGALDPDDTLFGLFRAAVEEQFRSRHDVAFYARG
jgi:hypothetical protein